MKLGNHNDIPFFSEIMCICRSFSFLVSKSKPRNVVTPMAPHHRLPMISWTATEPTGPTGSMKYGGFGRILLKKRDVVVNSCQLMSENLKIWGELPDTLDLVGSCCFGDTYRWRFSPKTSRRIPCKGRLRNCPRFTQKSRRKKDVQNPLFLPKKKSVTYPLGYVKIAIENGPLIDDLPSGNLT